MLGFIIFTEKIHLVYLAIFRPEYIPQV